MARSRTGQRNGHTRQRPASGKAKATSKAKPRRGAANGSGRATVARGSPTPHPGATKPQSARKATQKVAEKAAAKKSGSRGKGKATAAPKAADRAASKGAGLTEKLREATPDAKPRKIVTKLAVKAVKRVATKAKDSVLESIQTAAERAAEAGNGAVGTVAESVSHGLEASTGGAAAKLAHKRLPIQRSVDIAVPLRVAWEEWQALECLPEGTHNVTDIERDGEILTGRTTGPRSADWEAEILDERPEQSFAWQSHEGSDCAGLATFHRLSDRLTRIELNLDVVPTSPAEAASLLTHVADRRAEAELRRFKARLELINPDLYEEDEGTSPDEEEAEGEASDEEYAGEEPEDGD